MFAALGRHPRTASRPSRMQEHPAGGVSLTAATFGARRSRPALSHSRARAGAAPAARAGGMSVEGGGAGNTPGGAERSRGSAAGAGTRELMTRMGTAAPGPR
ncbi:hypothetical protein GCM10010421_41170 [Streptomyces glaucus]|uniref:Secreted protein n=1 Tax=Streptomyces glaucus TaxID=284029 RepID=A0ABN3K361_9ACTN